MKRSKTIHRFFFKDQFWIILQKNNKNGNTCTWKSIFSLKNQNEKQMLIKSLTANYSEMQPIDCFNATDIIYNECWLKVQSLLPRT